MRCSNHLHGQEVSPRISSKSDVVDELHALFPPLERFLFVSGGGGAAGALSARQSPMTSPPLAPRSHCPHRGRLPAQRRHPPHPLRLPAFEHSGIDLYLKDESTHPRAASSTGWRARCSSMRCAMAGCARARPSSRRRAGSTAVSEAYFARLLGLPFVAVMPRSTSPEKVAQIEFHGGLPHFVDSAGAVYDAARAIAAETGGLPWTSSPTPSAPPTGAATTTLPRACSRRCSASGTRCRAGLWWAQARGHQRHHRPLCALPAPRHAGVRGRPGGLGVQRVPPHGRRHAHGAGLAHRGHWPPRVEPSFIRTLVDRMVEVPDVESVAAMRALSQLLGRRVGPSTGTNFVAMLALAHEMRERGELRRHPRCCATRASATCPPIATPAGWSASLATARRRSRRSTPCWPEAAMPPPRNT